MSHFLRSVLVLTMSCVLCACGKDPVMTDLAALDKVAKVVFKVQTTEISEFNKKLAVAKTNEEKTVLLSRLIAALESQKQELAGFTATTPDVKKVSDLLTNGYVQTIDGAKEARFAFAKNDSAALSKATDKMHSGQKGIREGQQEFGKLVKEKGFKREN